MTNLLLPPAPSGTGAPLFASCRVGGRPPLRLPLRLPLAFAPLLFSVLVGPAATAQTASDSTQTTAVVSAPVASPAAKPAAQTLKPAQIETLAGIKIGYKNDDGQTVIKAKYDYGSDFQPDGYAIVGINLKYGCIDSTGRELVPIKFAEPVAFSEGLAPATLDGKKWGYITKTGSVAVPFTFDDVGDFNEGRAAVRLGKKLALINRKGTLLTPHKYTGIEEMKGGIARVCLRQERQQGGIYTQEEKNDVYKGHFWGFINAQGKEISPMNLYAWQSPNLGNGYAVCCYSKSDQSALAKNGNYRMLVGQTYTYSSALIDKTGKTIIPASAGYEFGNWGKNYLIVQRGDAYGVVDMTGQFLLPLNFSQISDFEFGPGNSLAKAFMSPDRFFYVDSKFQCVEFDGVKCPEQ